MAPAAAGSVTTPRSRRLPAKLGDGIQPSFYLDFPTVVSFIGLAAGSDPSYAKAKPYLDAFSAIVAGGKRDGDINRGRFVLGLK